MATNNKAVNAIKTLADQQIGLSQQQIDIVFDYIKELENTPVNMEKKYIDKHRKPFLDELEIEILDYMDKTGKQDMGKTKFIDFYNWLKDNEEV